MDPNANLAEIRKILAKSDEETSILEYERLAELMEALDNWLSQGGFLPEAWKKII